MSRNPIYPIDKMTIRPCMFCSFDTNDHIEWIEHMRKHTLEEKTLLTQGDVNKLQNILQGKLRIEMQEQQNVCKCNYNDCIHNFESPSHMRYRVLINKLRNYNLQGKNGVYSITAIPNNGFITRISEHVDRLRKQSESIQPYQYKAFYYKVLELLFQIPTSQKSLYTE